MSRTSLALSAALVLAAMGFAMVPTGTAETRGRSHLKELELVHQFDPALGEFPKGIAFTPQGDMYVGMQMLGEVRKFARDGTQTTVASIPFAGPPGTGFVTAVAVVAPWRNDRHIVYATFVDTHTGEANGIYRMAGEGSLSRVPGSEAIPFANGMTADHNGNLYVSDSTTGSIWRMPQDTGVASLWFQHDLLEGDGSLGFPVKLGVGDLTVDRRSLLVTVEEKSRVVRIGINADGTAAEPSVVVEDPSLYMTEGVAMASRGRIYISSWFNSTLNLLDKHGNLSVIADMEDGLLGPVTIEFGKGRLSQYLYVVNQSGFIFADPKPAIYRIKVGR